MQSVIHRICLWLLTLMTCFRHRMKLSASHSCFPSHLSTELPGHLQHEIFHRPTVRPVQPILWGRVVRESPRHLVWRKIPYYLNTAWWKTHLLHHSCKLWHHTVPRNQHKSGCYIFLSFNGRRQWHASLLSSRIVSVTCFCHDRILYTNVLLLILLQDFQEVIYNVKSLGPLLNRVVSA